MKAVIINIGYLLLFGVTVFAQDPVVDPAGQSVAVSTTLTDRDSASIIRVSEEVIMKRLPEKMNRISDKTYTDSDVLSIINSSFDEATTSARRLFDNRDNNVEDDQAPDLVAEGTPPRNKTAFTYLNDFYSSYPHGNDNSVECSHAVVTGIRPRSENPPLYDTVYVTVQFDISYHRDFIGTDRIPSKYPLMSRIAVLKAFNVNQEWRALIADISFNNSPDQLSYLGKYFTQLRKFPPKTINSLAPADKQQVNFILPKINKGDSLYFSNSYSFDDLPGIISVYQSAQDADPTSSYIKSRTSNLKLMIRVPPIDQDSCERFISEYKNAHRQRRYEEENRILEYIYYNCGRKPQFSDLQVRLEKRLNRINEVKNHIKNGNTPAAIAICDFEIGNSKEEDFEFFYLRADAAKDVNSQNAKKDINKAISLLEIPIKEFYILRADIQFKAGEFSDALTDYQLYEKLNEPYILFSIGECYFKMRDWDNARKRYSICIDLEKTNSMYYERRGDCFMNENSFEKAIDDYRQATRYGKNGSISYKTGNCYLKQLRPNYESCAKSYRDALEYGVNQTMADDIKDRTRSFYINGKTQFYNKAYDEAAIYFRSNVLLNPKNDSAWYYLGEIEYQTNLTEKSEKTEKALQYFDTCLINTPNFLVASIRKGHCFLRLGRYEEANESFTGSKDNSANTPETRRTILIGIGDALTGQGKRKEANLIYQQLILLYKDQSEVYFKMGKNLYDGGEFKEAISKFKDALERNSRYADALFWTGKSNYSLGRYSSALENYTTVREINSTYPHLLFEMGKCYFSRALEDKNNPEDLSSARQSFASEIQLSGFKDGAAYILKASCEFKLEKYTDCGLTLDNAMKVAKDSTVLNSDSTLYMYIYSKIMISDKPIASDLLALGFRKFPNSARLHYAQACFYAFIENNTTDAMKELYIAKASGNLVRKEVKEEFAFLNISKTPEFTAFLKTLR